MPAAVLDMNDSSTRYLRSAQWSSKIALSTSSTAASGYSRPGSNACATWSSSIRRRVRLAGTAVIRPSRMKGRSSGGGSARTSWVPITLSMTRMPPIMHGRAGRRHRPVSNQDVPGGTVSRVARYDDDLRFAHVLADNADDITTRRFRALDLRVETKPDLTPVSDADQATEESLRNILRRSRPRDAVLGEEEGRTGNGPRCWFIDPIDATKNYVRGVPVWATLIGLMDGDEVVAGVVTAPALGRRWWAAKGGGAWTGKSLTSASRCRESEVSKLADASFSYSGVGGWAETGRLDGFLSLSQAVWRTRGFGDFWSHMLVAEGAVDVSAEPDVSLWDLAALQVIVEEAGGRFTSLAGVATPSGGSVVCTNGRLHDEVLAHLSAR